MMEWSKWTAINVWLSGNVLEKKTISQEFLNEGWVNGVKSYCRNHKMVNLHW